MKVFELSKEYDVTNKEMIDFLKEKGFKVSSHSQVLTEDMIKTVKSDFKKAEKKDVEETIAEDSAVKKITKKTVPPKKVREFKPDDRIVCRSIVPWSVEMLGVDQKTPYKWSAFGDVEEVTFRDLQSWRHKPIVMGGRIMIEDPDICEMWKRDLGDMYKKVLGIQYPEEFFDLDDVKFEKMLREANDTLKEVIKFTAMDMIRNENYPSINKVKIIDDVLGTGIIDFVV